MIKIPWVCETLLYCTGGTKNSRKGNLFDIDAHCHFWSSITFSFTLFKYFQALCVCLIGSPNVPSLSSYLTPLPTNAWVETHPIFPLLLEFVLKFPDFFLQSLNSPGKLCRGEVFSVIFVRSQRRTPPPTKSRDCTKSLSKQLQYIFSLKRMLKLGVNKGKSHGSEKVMLVTL